MTYIFIIDWNLIKMFNFLRKILEGFHATFLYLHSIIYESCENELPRKRARLGEYVPTSLVCCHY